jgi:hypothetical protein
MSWRLFMASRLRILWRLHSFFPASPNELNGNGFSPTPNQWMTLTPLFGLIGLIFSAASIPVLVGYALFRDIEHHSGRRMKMPLFTLIAGSYLGICGLASMLAAYEPVVWAVFLAGIIIAAIGNMICTPKRED